MRRRTLLLLIILGLIIRHGIEHRHTTCAAISDAWGYDADHLLVDLHIPDVVTSYTSPYHEVMPATHLSLVRPAGYEPKVNFAGYIKDRDTCIDVIEDHTRGIDTKRTELDRYVSYIKNDRDHQNDLLYRKNFMFNGYNAFVVCLSDATRAHTSIYMAFGDQNFHVAMTGTMAENTEKNRAELIQTMLTAYYQRA